MKLLLLATALLVPALTLTTCGGTIVNAPGASSGQGAAPAGASGTAPTTTTTTGIAAGTGADTSSTGTNGGVGGAGLGGGVALGGGIGIGGGAGSGGDSSTGGSGSGGAGGGPALDCTIPSPPPSHGSCVAFTSDAGVELDAGLDDAGVATATNCNPITNEGCTGTDVCGLDMSEMFYVCQPVSSMPDVPVCGNCTAATAFCAVGGICVGVFAAGYICIQMCCTDADCGGTVPCKTTDVLETNLPSGVGVCVP